MGSARKPNETFDTYRVRRTNENRISAAYLKGRYITINKKPDRVTRRKQEQEEYRNRTKKGGPRPKYYAIGFSSGLYDFAMIRKARKYGQKHRRAA